MIYTNRTVKSRMFLRIPIYALNSWYPGSRSLLNHPFVRGNSFKTKSCDGLALYYSYETASELRRFPHKAFAHNTSTNAPI